MVARGGRSVIETQNPETTSQTSRAGSSAPAGVGPMRRARRLASYLIPRALILLVAIAAVVGVGGWLGSETAIHRGPLVYPWRLADYPDLARVAEPVTLTSRTGVQIAGRFFPGASRATIVLSHGYGGGQDEMLPYANFLHRAGYSVFTYDMRNRGGSGGDAITLGALEQEDLLSVVDYLAARPDVDPERIGAFGGSLGASTSILAAARDQRIKAVVTDGPFADVASVVDTGFTAYIGLPAFPFSPVTVRIAEWRTGQRVADVRPVTVVGRISPRALLLIHGREDVALPPVNSERLYAAAGEPKELWLVPGTGHSGARGVDRAEYERRVIAFFRRYLGP